MYCFDHGTNSIFVFAMVVIGAITLLACFVTGVVILFLVIARLLMGHSGREMARRILARWAQSLFGVNLWGMKDKKPTPKPKSPKPKQEKPKSKSEDPDKKRPPKKRKRRGG